MMRNWDNPSSRSGHGDWSDNLNFLYPDFVPVAFGRSIFCCPSSDNYISTATFEWTHHDAYRNAIRKKGLRDLNYQSDYAHVEHAPQGKKDPKLRGVSYEINSYFSWDIRKTIHNVANWSHYHDAGQFKMKGKRVRPSDIYLIFDGDSNGNRGKPGSHNNFPDDYDNHGRDGVNMLMCDGSVKWTNGGTNYIYAYELSQDENRTGIPNLP